MSISHEQVVAVIGGGASGSLAALQLLSLDQPAVVHLFNEGNDLGRGVAYSTSSDQLLLNVAASCMSAWPDRPDDFFRWLQVTHPDRFQETSFVPRRIYGQYLRNRLAEAGRLVDRGRFQIHDEWVDHVKPKKHGFLISTRTGSEIRADSVILALGHRVSAPTKPDATLHHDRYVADPWALLAEPDPTLPKKDILILGSGLTAVDVVVRLREQGYTRKIFVMSRRGQWPTGHAAYSRAENFQMPNLIGLSPGRMLSVLRRLAKNVEQQGGNWRQVVDGFRPITNTLWGGWTTQQQERFLHHLRPYWDSHRHRLAPDVAEKLQREISAGSVELLTSRLISTADIADGVRVSHRRRRNAQIKSFTVSQIINCTGSQPVTDSSCQSLIAGLLELDLARLDPSLPGLATDENGELLDSTARPITNLFAIGPLRRGTLWETTAVPEIRSQAEKLARYIASRCRPQAEGARATTELQEVC